MSMSAPTPTIHWLTAPRRLPAAVAPPRQRRSTATFSLREGLQPQPQAPPLQNISSRRAALLLLLLAASPRCSSAAVAFSIGIPGPKDFLREQKKKSARYVLAPIDASRRTLLGAQTLLTSPNVAPEDAEEVRQLLVAAARDCVPQQRSPLVAFQSRTGVEVCTFTLILKNAASLLADKDPVKVEAEARLGELIQSFSDLGISVENNFGLSGDREKMEDDLMGTISALDKFEQSIKDCLGI